MLIFPSEISNKGGKCTKFELIFVGVTYLRTTKCSVNCEGYLFIEM